MDPHKLDRRLQDLRTLLLRPLLRLLDGLHIHPNHITIFGLLVGLGIFALLLVGRYQTAAILILFAVLVDGIDGSLARFQGSASDRGKFLDMNVDSYVATLLILGLMHQSLISPLIGGVLIYLMVLGLVYSTILDALHHKSDWLFHTRAGFMAQWPKFTYYGLFVLFAFTSIDVLEESAFLFIFYLLIVDALRFARILHVKYAEKQ